MNGVLLMVVAAAVLACGYLGYGRWLANKIGRASCRERVSSPV